MTASQGPRYQRLWLPFAGLAVFAVLGFGTLTIACAAIFLAGVVVISTDALLTELRRGR